MTTSAAVVLSEVSQTFRTADGVVTAVDDVSLRVGHSEIMAFPKPNGMGKPTTIDTVLGLMVPSAGHVDVLWGPRVLRYVRAGVCVVADWWFVA